MTIDAIGCQVAIADKIIEHQADYLLALKGNQPTLETEVADYFSSAPAEELVCKTTIEKGHGRIETRTYTASSKVDRIVSDRSYPGGPRFTTIKTILKVDLRTEYPDRSTFDTRLYISSVALDIEGWPTASAATGGWKACTGCSMSSSKTICPDTAAATEPRTWLSCVASRLAWFAPIKAREASKLEENQPAGTQTTFSSCCSSAER